MKPEENYVLPILCVSLFFGAIVFLGFLVYCWHSSESQCEPKLEHSHQADQDTTLLLRKLDEASQGVQKIASHMQRTTPEGLDVLVFDGTVTVGKKIDLLREYPYKRLFKAEVYNFGPNTVDVMINGEKEVPVETEETIIFDKGKPAIESIILRVLNGSQTRLKILGRY